MIYVWIYHQILQNVICSRMTQHFIQQEKASCKFKRRYSFVLIVFQCSATLITCSLILGEKSVIITTRQKHQLSDVSLRLSSVCQNIENVTEHRLLGFIVDTKFRWQAQIECRYAKACKKEKKCFFFLNCSISSTSIPENVCTTLT